MKLMVNYQLPLSVVAPLVWPLRRISSKKARSLSCLKLVMPLATAFQNGLTFDSSLPGNTLSIPPPDVSSLLQTGKSLHIQNCQPQASSSVRSVACALAGDWKGADVTALTLPETGVCSLDVANLEPEAGASDYAYPKVVKAVESSVVSCCQG